jgi:3-oxoacyl-[acyl-carrier protein] reductase
MKTLRGKTAFITGGTRGIGEGIVRRLAQEGANIAFTYSKTAQKAEQLANDLKASGTEVLPLLADSSQEGAISQAIASTVERFGKIDILVNNAGYLTYGNVDEGLGKLAEFNSQLNVNVRAVTEAVRAAVKHLSSGGRIINIGSCAGTRVGAAGIADYAGHKAALQGYTRGWAWDLGHRNITVNVVEPGPVATEDNPEAGEFFEHMCKGIPLGRYAQIGEVASVVNFLAGPDAAYITGASFAIDGGLTA